MNIANRISSHLPIVNARSSATARLETEAAQPPATEKLTSRDPNAEFFTSKESPWLPKTSTGEVHPAYRNLSEQALENRKAYYLKELHEKADEHLRHMFDSFTGFKDQLSYINPELAKKHFGFTMGFDQQIKVTDPDGVLTPNEKGYLTEQLNNRSKLQRNVCAHARLLMEFNDHDRKNFPDRHKINLENYSKIVDYGQLFTRNTIGGFNKTLNYQLERNAEKIEESNKGKKDEKQPQALVDVHA